MNGTEFILWIKRADYADGQPIKAARGTVRQLRKEQAFREKNGFRTVIYAKGDKPVCLMI